MNCAAITASLVESELFGVRKGVYTGTDAARLLGVSPQAVSQFQSQQKKG